MSTKLGFTFYPKDWWTSETYFTLTLTQRYLFLECLFIMYSNNGYLSNNKDLLQNRLRTEITNSDWEAVTKEFLLEGKNFTSTSVNKRLKRAISNRENGKKGGAPKGNNNATKQPNQPKKTTQNNPPLERERERERESKREIEDNILLEKELKNKTTKIENIDEVVFEEVNSTDLKSEEISQKKVAPKKRFSKPTIVEIREYCFERNNQVNPEKFFDHYESNGWMVGKTKMKDWKAAIRTWEKNTFNNQNQNKNGQQQERFIGRQSIDTIQHNATVGYEATERVRKQMLNNSD
ncbi:hypothetical protein [Myroides sp. LoEW2-1]|uniref:hypothetical protein n=1 Tax=Myroides sp. LoEW2-1 TaxID=2683192 RepID=UPI001AA15CEF|nr:hypothetical protein [Myroides sp. LoEW2-1]